MIFLGFRVQVLGFRVAALKPDLKCSQTKAVKALRSTEQTLTPLPKPYTLNPKPYTGLNPKP